jgi:hypothetical protein
VKISAWPEILLYNVEDLWWNYPAAITNYRAPLHNIWSTEYDINGQMLNNTSKQTGMVTIKFNMPHEKEYFQSKQLLQTKGTILIKFLLYFQKL